ncbi:MAG: FMN-binding glutamate synthase family protein, partial [Firmicutes bacterium]|nr:FMN-binding glutamate synthase family protein [Bacillota bacterium]
MKKKYTGSMVKNFRWVGLGLFGAAGAAKLGRWLLGRAARETINKIMTEPYHKNLWEVVSAGSRATPQVIVETNLRAQEGQKIMRPLGGPKKFPDFSGLMFNVAQLASFPTSEDVPVDASVVLGKRAARPMRLEIPIIISGMAYGFVLSEKAKIALARGASLAGTATNTGQGPFLQSERNAAKHLILQYNRGSWCKEPKILRQADMIEIQLGHAARAGIGQILKSKEIDNEVRKRLGIAPSQDIVTHSRQPGISSPEELGKIVSELREITKGVPIGVKIAAGNSLEEDLAYILEAQADIITIDGSPGGSGGSLPILQDDFCLPTLYALCRASRFLKRQGVKEQVDLIISGGLKTPGDYLKALALGADAVAIGSIALFAVTHTQVLKALPFEPPIEVVYQNGAYKNKFDVKKGAKHLSNYLFSSTEEMKEAARAMGKTALGQVSKDDLFALDGKTAEIAGVPYGGNLSSFSIQ